MSAVTIGFLALASLCWVSGVVLVALAYRSLASPTPQHEG